MRGGRAGCDLRRMKKIWVTITETRLTVEVKVGGTMTKKTRN